MVLQAPQTMITGWRVGMNSQITNCRELTTSISSFKQFSNFPIHVKLQQLRIGKEDTKLAWKYSDRSKVVIIRCTHHLYKSTVKTLKKMFNNKKL